MLRLRFVYGLALASAAAITMAVAAWLHSSVWLETTLDDLIEVGIRQKPWLVISVLVGSFVTGTLFWQPRRSQDLAIDIVRTVGVMVGLSFWISALIAGCVWAFTPGHEINAVQRFVIGPAGAALMGGPLGAGFAGPIGYLVGAIVLWPLRRLEPVTEPDSWRPIGGAVIGVLALCSAGIALLSAVVWIAMLVVGAFGLVG